MKKVLVLGMVLVLCLAVVGVGYAGWVKNLDIEGTVNTGNVELVITELGSSDNEADGKDVSWITCEVIGDILFVDVTNAYPCITYVNEFLITSTGTVPMHIEIVTLSDVPAWAEVSVVLDGTLPIQLHEGGCVTGRVIVHLLNPAPQGEVLTFSATINAIQYNETLL